MKKKVLSIVIAAAMLFTMPVVSFADEVEDQNSIGTATELNEETEMVLDKGEEGSLLPAEFEPKQQGKMTPKAASQECGDNLIWKLTDGILTISGSGAMNDFEYGEELPWDYEGNTITKVVIEDGVTSIGSFAFANCSNLTEIQVGEDVTSIGEAAFYECYNLEAAYLPDSVKTINYAAFADCYSLKEISGNGIEEVADYAFQDTAITKFHIPEGCDSISMLAFFNAEIAEITVADGNKTYSVNNGILYINNGKTLFYCPKNKNISSVEIPAGVTKIGTYAFFQSVFIENIVIPDTVKSISDGAFADCTSLISIEIPDSVTELGDYIMEGCSHLETAVLGDGITTTSYRMFYDCSNLKNITFGENLDTIYALTFAYCCGLKEIELPANIQTIGNGSFGGCTGLTKVVAHGIKENVPFQAFLNCESLTTVELNEGVKEINRYAFRGCYNLETITLPESVKHVHFDAFEEDTNIICKDPLMAKYGINGYRYIQPVHVDVTQKYDFAEEVLELVNKEREAEGLNPLNMSGTLTESAMARAGELVLLFSHTRPNSANCFTIDSDMIAENVAIGQFTPEDVMASWMNSEGHRANILSDYSETIGIGCVEHDGGYYWVQCFGDSRSNNEYTDKKDRSVNQKVEFAIDTFEEATVGGDIQWGGDDAQYLFEPELHVGSKTLKPDGTTSAHVEIVNPGFIYFSAVINNDDIEWQTSNADAVTVSSKGAVKALKSGQSTITAKMLHYAPYQKITVACASHNYVQDTITPATMEVKGSIISKCTVCGKTSTKTIARLDRVTISKTSYAYDGKAHKPLIKVYDINEKLVDVSNYSVTYPSGRKNVGKYTVIVKMNGEKYSGTFEKTFKINPKATSISSLTKGSKKFTAKWYKRSVQVTGYQVRYSTSSKFSSYKTKTITSYKTTKTTISKLKAKKYYYVKVRTYKTVKGVKYYSAWSKYKKIKTN